MTNRDIVIGEIYLFVATDNPTRKHLEGKEFQVIEKNWFGANQSEAAGK